MTRIRKRPPSATSSVKPELLATSNGCPPQLGAQSNPSFQDPRQALLCAASWPVKEDRLLLVSPAATNSGHGGSLASEKEVKKQLAATPAARHYAKPYIIAQRGGDGEGLGMTRKTMTVGEAKLRDTEVHQQEYRARKHMLDGEGDETCIASKREAENRSCHAGGGERSEGACKERAILAGSEQFTGKLRHTDPSDADDGASEQPRKMLPLQLILNSVPRHATAAPRPMIPNDQLLRTTASDTMMPSSSSTSVSCGTKRLNLKQQWEVDDSARVGGSEQKPSLLQTRKPQPLSEEAPESESSDVKIQGGSKSMREERGGLSSSDQSPDWPVSSWQGHRRARSSGRLVNEAAPGLLGRVNLDAHHAPINSKIITSERKVKVFPIEKSKAGTQLKKTPLPASEKVISVPLKNLSPSNCASKKRKRDAAAANGDVTHYSSAAPDSSHDHAILADSMRCRRKDGRRWQCKDQVVKPGAPFCHYHTLKMREKHATSAARRLAKRRNKEPLINIVGRSARPAPGSDKRQKPARSSVLQDGGARRVARVQEEEDEEEEEEDDDDDDDEDDEEFEEEENSDSGSDQGKQQQMQQNSKSRWRKKCKPCIRRLLDIQDRARPAVADCLQDYAASSSVWVVHPPSPVPLRRPPSSPLPECHLNTDPFEWRSDFP